MESLKVFIDDIESRLIFTNDKKINLCLNCIYSFWFEKSGGFCRKNFKVVLWYDATDGKNECLEYVEK